MQLLLPLFLFCLTSFSTANEIVLIDEVFFEFIIIAFTVAWLFDEWAKEWEERAFQKRYALKIIFAHALEELARSRKSKTSMPF
jgi:hypothetical protein